MLLNIIILELLLCFKCWCILVCPVPMLTVDWSCHSFLLVEVFIDAFTLFPRGAIWLCCPKLYAWLGIFCYTYVHTLLQNKLSCIHSKMGDIHIYEINHTNHANGKGPWDLVFLTPFCRAQYLFPKQLPKKLRNLKISLCPMYNCSRGASFLCLPFFLSQFSLFCRL